MPASRPARRARRARRAAGLLAAALLGAACAGGRPAGVPEEVVRENILGTAHLGQQDWTEAAAAFRRALALRPDDPLLATNLGIALTQQGEIEPAVEQLRAALAADPDYAPAHYNLGLIESRRGNFEEATRHFEAVARFDSGELFTQYYLASSLSRIDRETEAIAAFRHALELNPDHVSSLYGLGRLLLQRGEQDEGARLIQRSQEIRSRSGLDVAVGSQYGEQGPYGMGIDYPGDALAAPAPIEVTFERKISAAHEPAGETSARAALPAAALLATGDGRTALVLSHDGGLRRLDAAGWSEPLAPPAAVVRAGDLDGDGAPELVVLADGGAGATLGVLVAGDGAWAARRIDTAGLAPAPGAAHDLVLVDADHDGDLDLFWCWVGTDAGAGSGCALGTNDGAGGLALRPASEHGFALAAGGPGPIRVAFSDVDNDRDVDLLAAGPAGVQVFSNLRDGSFGDISERAGLARGTAATSLVVADLNKDGWMDLVVGGAGLELYLNRRGRFEAARAFAVEPGLAASAVVFDYDNDGFLDLARSAAGGVALIHNDGAGGWSERPQRLGVGGSAATGGEAGSGAPLAALDADGDGDLDLATYERTEGAAHVALHVNEGGNANRWIRLDSRGVGDNRFGIGAKVEVLAGALRQKFEVAEPVPLHVGLGSRGSVQSVRYVWPSGVLQDEIELASGATATIEQLDRKGTSCPLLYAWRDGGWAFVNDFLGGSAIGYQLAPGVYSTPDTDEVVRIDGGLDEAPDGTLRLRLNNQLEEVIWFDRAELLVVDHPADAAVWADERLMPGPPFPALRLLASSDVRPVLAARGVEDGLDLTARLAAADRRYADNFALLRPKGYAETHTLELDLGPLPQGRRVVLLLDGWTDYADSTSNLAAHQAGLTLVPPRLRVADGSGGWSAIARPMGFPAGLPRTMTVELTGLFRSTDHRLRIETNMRVYWDRARVLVGGEDTDLDVRRLSAERAELRFGGFPRESSPDGRPPFGYDPGRVEPARGWKAHVGAYTPFGDVTARLRATDDRFVTTRNGDEIELVFRAPAPPAPGRARTYFLYADGFGKDMDLHSAASDTVAPIPFHAMAGYPYPAGEARPAADDDGGGAPRTVPPSPRGWPGAVPLARTRPAPAAPAAGAAP